VAEASGDHYEVPPDEMEGAPEAPVHD
jgi:hypothetical protein